MNRYDLNRLKDLFIRLMLLNMPLLVCAQNEFYNKGAAVYIQEQGLIHIQGELVNTGAGASEIKNDGIIEVKGDFENQPGASFGINSAGTTDRAVRFVGPESGTTQTIKGDFSSDTAGIFNMVVDLKTSADQVVLQTAARINGSLVFGSGVNTSTYSTVAAVTANNNRGIVNTGSYLLDITNSNTDAIKGYDAFSINNSVTTGFIISNGSKNNNGGLQRAVNNASYEYPIGTHIHKYNPVRINFTSVYGGGSVKGKFNDVTGDFGVVGGYQSHYPSSPTPPLPPDNTGFNYWFPNNLCTGTEQWLVLENAVQNHGYWSFEGTGVNTSYNYSIEVYPTNYLDFGLPGDLTRAIKHSGTAYNADATIQDWSPEIESSVVDPNDLMTYTKNAGCYSGNGVPGGRYNGFSHFGVSKAKTGSSLPVELIYLDATPVNGEYIQVSWQTSLEINNSGFDVMRSTDGANWTVIGWVDGNNNSTVTQSYSFDDRTALPNTGYYYKLNQKDNDGQSTYTHSVYAIIQTGETFTISEFMPNPAKDASKLIINTGTSMPAEIKLVDVLGRVVALQRETLTVGENILHLGLQHLPNATYTVILQAGGKQFSKRLVVTSGHQ